MMVKRIQEMNSMKPIAYFENRYLISESGQVTNLANNGTLKPITNPNGYLKVGLANGDGTHKQYSVHHLVARHYLPNPYEHKQVNHKDGDKTNNHVSNLEWCTAKENILHAFQTGLRPGYMSANDKEMYLYQALAGHSVPELAASIGRRPETLSKMLRETAKRLGIHDEWVTAMKGARKNAAIRNLSKINN